MRIESLTFLRFCAAFVVLTYHWAGGTVLKQPYLEILNKGPAMVTFFFVLSGFVLAITYIDRDMDRCYNFYVARVARIAPAYIAAFLIIIPFTYGEYTGFNVDVAVVLHLLFLQAWVPHYAVTLNMAAWAISVQMVFYLIFPFIFPLMRQRHLSTASVLMAAMALYLISQAGLIGLMNMESFGGPGSAVNEFIRFNPLSHLCSFVLGIAGAIWFLREQAFKDQNRNGLIPMLIVGAVIVFVLNNESWILGKLPLVLPVESSIYAPLFLAFILIVANSNNFLVSAMGRGPFLALGNASYGFYIYQFPVIFVLYSGLQITSYLDANQAFAILFASLLILSLLSHYYFERPALRKIRQSVSRVVS